MTARLRKKRADVLLAERGLAESREQAQVLIMEGLVFAPSGRVLKASSALAEDIPLEVRGRLPYVSRGGLKLAGALDTLSVNVKGKTALDVGASTGGFTDCLLQRGATHVFAVDVGHGQLHHRLRQDPRVTTLEKVNARYPYDLPASPHPVVADPVAADSVVADPVVADPVAADPVVADPVVADPVVTDPVVADSVVADSVVADSVVADPVVADPVVADSVVADPVVTDPVAADPVVVDLVVVDLVVVDVSFISLALVLPPALSHLTPGGHILALVKPQFEAPRGQVGRGGIVKDPRVHASVLGNMVLWATREKLKIKGMCPSPILGDKGNREFFLLLQKPPHLSQGPRAQGSAPSLRT